MDQLFVSEKGCIDPAQAVLKNVQASLGTTLHLESEKGRLEWKSTRKRKSERALKLRQDM